MLLIPDRTELVADPLGRHGPSASDPRFADFFGYNFGMKDAAGFVAPPLFSIHDADIMDSVG